MSEQERRNRLDAYRVLCKELDKDLVKALSHEDKKNPDDWTAKGLFGDVVSRFLWLMEA